MRKIVILLFKNEEALRHVMSDMAEVVKYNDGEILYTYDLDEGRENEEE